MSQSSALFAMSTLCVWLGCAWAPSADRPLTPRTHIRLTTRAATDRAASLIVGTLVHVDRDTIVLTLDEDGTQLAVPVVSVDSLHVRQTRSNALRGAGLGVAVGGTIGGLYGAATAPGGGSGDAFDLTTEQGALLFGLAGGIGGLVIGTLVGAAIPSERWVPMTVDSVAVVAGR